MEDIKILLQQQTEEIAKRVEDDVSDKIAKKVKDEVSGEIKRHIDVLNENFSSQVSLVAEQYSGIEKALKSHTEMIGAMKEDIEVIKVNVEFIKGSLKKKVDVEEFETLESRVSLLESKAHA